MASYTDRYKNLCDDLKVHRRGCERQPVHPHGWFGFVGLNCGSRDPDFTGRLSGRGNHFTRVQKEDKPPAHFPTAPATFSS